MDTAEYFTAFLLPRPGMAFSQMWRILTKRPVTLHVLCQQSRDVIARIGLRRRGCRAGKHRHRLEEAARLLTSLTAFGYSSESVTISVIVGNRRVADQKAMPYRGWREDQEPARKPISRYSTVSQIFAVTTRYPALPTLFVLNAASLAKPRAIQHLSADLLRYDVHIAVITETHLKKHHTDLFAAITGYSVFRRDRAGRKGGGVAVYVGSRMPATVWTCPNDSPLFELLWIRVRTDARDVIIGALYHPPQPMYKTSDLLGHIGVCVDAVKSSFPDALIILAGDFNALPEDDVVARTAMCSIVDQPTRGANKLDRIYASEPSYTSIKVVTSAGKSDHKAIIAHSGSAVNTANKNQTYLTFRHRFYVLTYV